jgi:chromosome segregation ATPase
MTLTEEQRGTVGVDLEKARAALEEAIDRMSLAVRDEDGDVWEADPEQAEILQAILDRTEIAENHRCLELQYQLDSAESEIERLRAALAESEKVVEHKGKSATHWYDEHLRAQTDLTQSKRVIEQLVAKIKELETAYLKAQNSNLLRKQEIERLRPFEIAARDLDSDLGKIAGERDEQSARIKELEDAHKRAGAKYAKIIRELRSSVYANIPGLKKQWDEVLAEGKIGSGGGA